MNLPYYFEYAFDDFALLDDSGEQDQSIVSYLKTKKISFLQAVKMKI